MARKTAIKQIVVAQEPTAGSVQVKPVSRASSKSSSARIGSKLKHTRLIKGYTLRELAEIIDCSESMLSKVENEKLTPSISFLHRLAEALDTSIAALFAENEDPAGPVHVFPADRRARFEEDPELGRGGTWFERIIPISRSGLLQANILNIPPGVESDGTVQHIGEELGYMIEGELDIIVDGKTHVVRAGDVFFFPSYLAHGFRNSSEIEARVLKVNTPPTL